MSACVGWGGDSLDHCLPVGLPAGVRLGGVQRNAAMLMIPHVRACDAQIHIASVTAILWSGYLPPGREGRLGARSGRSRRTAHDAPIALACGPRSL